MYQITQFLSRILPPINAFSHSFALIVSMT